MALRNVPKDLYEAAEIDGAGKSKKFFSITLPLISPTTLFLTIQAVIGSLQVFDQAYVLTKGGPGDSSSTMVFYIWQNAFQKMDMGYGTTLALLLFVFVMIVTAVSYTHLDVYKRQCSSRRILARYSRRHCKRIYEKLLAYGRWQNWNFKTIEFR